MTAIEKLTRTTDSEIGRKLGIETLYFNCRDHKFVVTVKDFARESFQVEIVTSDEPLAVIDYVVMLQELQKESDSWVDDLNDSIRDDIRDEEGE